MNLQSRRALLKQFAPQYREASSAQKRVLLDTFAQATDYHRGSGIWLLNHAEEVLHAPVYVRPSQYGPEVQHALFLFRELKRRAPDAISHYKSARESRGMRKIRAHLLQTFEEQWQEEVIHGPSPTLVLKAEGTAGISSDAGP